MGYLPAGDCGYHGRKQKREYLKMESNNLVCVPVEHNSEFLWCVFEKSTDQVIKSFYFEEEAVEYIRFVQSGGAFTGYTPAFILTEFSTKSKVDINEEFSYKLN